MYDPWILDTGQLLIQALKAVRKPLVIDTQLMKNRRVHIANMNRVFQDVVTVIIRLTVLDTRFKSSSGKPGREATAVVITAMISLGQLSL